MYTPDKYLILKIETGDNVVDKVLATWAGGYLTGDSWRLSSGIKEVVDNGEYRDFIGESGSVYRCYKKAYGICGAYNYGVLDKFKTQTFSKATVYEEDPYGK